MEMSERLAEFFRRLEAASPAATAEAALGLVCRLIEEVEDELCPLPRENPPPRRFTGRMYAPQPDHIDRLDDGTIEAYTRRHQISCFPNGSIEITHAEEGTLEIFKLGKTP